MPFDFDPQATSFSITNAKLLGQASAVAYQNETACRQWARDAGLDGDFDFFSSGTVVHNTDTSGFVAQNDQIVLVAFRGTQPNVPVDWMSDFNALHETWGHPVGKVHKGFYEALRVVWGLPFQGREILPARLLSRGDRSVWFTGHSLGGALAELCAAQSQFVAHVPVQGVYTFGQPRCGDEAYASLLQSALGTRIFRFVNDRDIVPRVPFYGMGFRHYGGEIFFDHQMQQVDMVSALENLASAIKLAFGALNFDPIELAAQMTTEAVKKALFSGNFRAILDELMKARENAAFGHDIQKLLQSGTENIADHNMTDQYLVRLGTTLVLKAAATASEPAPPVH
jgi:triacylglycerol lipase